MEFSSILYPSTIEKTESHNETPHYFSDLNLDQLVTAILHNQGNDDTRSFYESPAADLDTILYRQDISRDLEKHELKETIKGFCQDMGKVRNYFKTAGSLSYQNFKNGWLMEGIALYAQAVANLVENLETQTLLSVGLTGFRDYLRGYYRSEHFSGLLEATKSLKTNLSAVQYCVIIKDNWVHVKKYEGEEDYSVQVRKAFEKFKQKEVRNYSVDIRSTGGMGHVESRILDYVASLFPEVFRDLEAYCLKYHQVQDPVILRFDREIQFFVAYLDFIQNLKTRGLPFCYPTLLTTHKNVHLKSGFDLTLAYRNARENIPVVCNDLELSGSERIIVVSGPNQGGKTTFARMFGQVHYLARLGLPVPGLEAELYLCDELYTHFEKEEDIRSLRGKLQDELVRIQSILDKATPRSIIIMNEIFTSTSLSDAVFLSKEIIRKITELDALCVCVSFIDELSTLNDHTISMVSTVDAQSNYTRTFKIIRRPADGRAYAISIVDKHGLTQKAIMERISS